MTQSIKVILRNPLDKKDQVDYTIESNDTSLANDWVQALTLELNSNRLLEKNFCFMGFPNTARTLPYLCAELNQAVMTINAHFSNYKIVEIFTPENCVSYDYADNGPNHNLFNKLHNHFEILQGTVGKLSDFYRRADHSTKYAIRQLNNLCHEIDNLILSLRKAHTMPQWVRPSQLTTFLQALRYKLKDEHRQGFLTNGYDRVLGGVYMHWGQIGKTLYEVFRDEAAPTLTDTVCEAITELIYYSGEFDVEWGNDITRSGDNIWHTREQTEFRNWLLANGHNPENPNLSLGYLPLGQVTLQQSFGSIDSQDIWDILSSHLDIYRIEIGSVTSTFDYCWTDVDYKQQQINRLKAGYDYSSRG